MPSPAPTSSPIPSPALLVGLALSTAVALFYPSVFVSCCAGVVALTVACFAGSAYTLSRVLASARLSDDTLLLAYGASSIFLAWPVVSFLNTVVVGSSSPALPVALTAWLIGISAGLSISVEAVVRAFRTRRLEKLGWQVAREAVMGNVIKVVVGMLFSFGINLGSTPFRAQLVGLSGPFLPAIASIFLWNATIPDTIAVFAARTALAAVISF